MKRGILLLLLLFVFIGSVVYATDNKIDTTYISEEFSFNTKENLVLSGTLTIPSKFDNNNNNKLVILVTAPKPRDRDYGGMYSNLASYLSQRGIATFRYDNRAYVKKIGEDDGDLTMYDASADAHDAFVALKKDNRFSNTSIGMLGHSEGGNAVIIEMSKNEDLSFGILLSSIAIDGASAYYSQISPLMNLQNKIPVRQRNEMLSLTYNIIEIVKNYSEKDSIEHHIMTRIKTIHNDSSTYYALFRNDPIEKVVDKEMKRWLRPHGASFIRHNPELYYDKISKPILAFYAMFDGAIDWKSNSEELQKIFIRNKKNNYEIVIVPNADHNFNHAEGWIPMGISIQRKGEHPPFATDVWEKISDWIKEQK